MKQLHHILDASFLIYLLVFLETPRTKAWNKNSQDSLYFPTVLPLFPLPKHSGTGQSVSPQPSVTDRRDIFANL